VTAFVDSDALIDCLRGNPAAREWVSGQRAGDLLVPGIVALELIAGCRNRAEQGDVLEFLAQFPIVWPEPPEGAAALGLYVKHGLSGGIGVDDCIVAAMAVHRGVRLLTFNLRHYRVVAGLDVAEPYARS
jgi:predicted nucleic acid-binding protein